MIELIAARITKYKSIEDSTKVDFDPKVTVLVGKNESGKSAFLEAVHKALPLGGAKFNFVFDYPRKDYIRDRSKFDDKSLPVVTQLWFRLAKGLAERINSELFAGQRVIPEGLEFIRSTSYSNTHTIDLAVDNKLALIALKQPLKDIAFADEVFDGATTLKDVTTAIEAKELDPDNRLAVFAKDWGTRTAEMSAGWDPIRWHVWSKYLAPALPRFLYFDDYRLLQGKVNLDALQQRVTAEKLTGSDETVMGLFDLAGTDLSE